jgi:hypothetical protein
VPLCQPQKIRLFAGVICPASERTAQDRTGKAGARSNALSPHFPRRLLRLSHFPLFLRSAPPRGCPRRCVASVAAASLLRRRFDCARRRGGRRQKEQKGRRERREGEERGWGDASTLCSTAHSCGAVCPPVAFHVSVCCFAASDLRGASTHQRRFGHRNGPRRLCCIHLGARVSVPAMAMRSASFLDIPRSTSSAPLSRVPSSFQEVVHPPEEVAEEEGKSLGAKSIGPYLSFMFIINQVPNTRICSVRRTAPQLQRHRPQAARTPRVEGEKQPNFTTIADVT